MVSRTQRLALDAFHNLNEKRVGSNRDLKFPCTRSKNFSYSPLKRDDSAKPSYPSYSFIHLFIHKILIEPMLYEGHHVRAKINVAQELAVLQRS